MTQRSSVVLALIIKQLRNESGVIIVAVCHHNRVEAAFERPRDARRRCGTRAVCVGPYASIDENPGAASFHKNRRPADLTASAQHLHPQGAIYAGMSYRTTVGRHV